MDAFILYLEIGLEHILDVRQGLDHVLFILALTVACHPREWKKLLAIITAFTIGHSCTLALATLDVIRVSVPLVEFLIVMTILFTAVSNLFTSDEQKTGNLTVNFWYAAFFGLIHGLGFSNTLRSLLMGSESIAGPLFSFNLGLELGQVVVVVLFLTITFMATDRLRVTRRDWKMVCSGAIAGMALMLLLERLP